jgi:hypothetical protein
MKQYLTDGRALRIETVVRDSGVASGEVDVRPWGSFVCFGDPDGNTWALQQLAARTN